MQREHQFHCVPDITNEQKLKSVWKDAKTTMNKILRVLKEVYGLPENMQLMRIYYAGYIKRANR